MKITKLSLQKSKLSFIASLHITRKFLLTSICLLFVFTLFTGCASTKLSKSFNKKTVENNAKEIVADLNSGDYDSVCAMVPEAAKSSWTSDLLSKSVSKTYGSAGKFEKFKKISVIGQTDSKTKTDYAVCLLQAKYEKKDVIFTITFDTEMKLAGLYMK